MRQGERPPSSLFELNSVKFCFVFWGPFAIWLRLTTGVVPASRRAHVPGPSATSTQLGGLSLPATVRQKWLHHVQVARDGALAEKAPQQPRSETAPLPCEAFVLFSTVEPSAQCRFSVSVQDVAAYDHRAMCLRRAVQAAAPQRPRLKKSISIVFFNRFGEFAKHL